jgi:Rieske 2Fe-2S family protein
MDEIATDQPSSRSLRTSLPQRFYTDEGVYRQELSWLRRNMWFAVGHESQIPNSGDYFLYEFDKDSVIVIRDNENQIRAHHNVCRHRGSRICVSTSGSVRTITCPYHAWSYDLDGALRGARFAARDFDKAAYALASCHVRVHCGLIFLSFAETPPDFESYVGLLTRELELQNIQHSKVAKRAVFSANANWKLAVQNNLECYHCGPAHPTYCAAHPGIPLGRPEEYLTQTRYERVRNSAEGSTSEGERQFQPVHAGYDSQYFQYVDRQLIGKGVMTESVGGKAVAPLMGRSAYDGVQTIGLPSPLTSVILNPDHAVIFSFTPRSVRRTDMEVIWLVSETAVEGVDLDVSRLVTVFEQTVKEDKTLVENAQLGVDSSAYRPGPYSQSEAVVSEFDRWYVDRVANEQMRDLEHSA